jgi:uncharacterized membrane protein YdjX (TVP38/TMEM64 family)
VVGVLALGWASWELLDSIGAEALMRSLGPIAPLVSIPIHVALSATPFPSEIVGLANGAVYGLWFGTVCSWLGWWWGALVEYEVARRGASDVEHRVEVDRLPRWLRRFPVGHPFFLIVGRQLPFGFHVVNLLAGAARVSRARFVFCAAISNLAYGLLATAMGAGLVSFGSSG